jgi:hypothetical protein
VYLFPLIDELQFLIGATMTQIIVDPYQVRFRLDGTQCGAQLTSGYAFEFKRSNGQTEAYRPDQKSKKFSAIHFHEMLEDKLADINLSADGLRLCLSFSRGSELAVLSRLGGYECGTIACGGGEKRFWVF